MPTDDTSNDEASTILGDLDKNGQPVNKRVGTAAKAQEIGNRFIRDDVTRSKRRLMVQGKFNGNAPKTVGQMLAAKRGGDSNLNWKQHKGYIINAWTPFFDLVCEVPVCIDGDLNIGDPAQDADLIRGIAEEFHDMVFGWDGFDDMNQLCDLQMLLHGVGSMVWEDEWTWYPRPVLSNNFYIPDETKASLENCEEFMVTRNWKAGELYRKIRDTEGGPTMGWFPDVVKSTIMGSGDASAIQAYGKIWDRWEQAFKNGDLYISQTQTKDIPLATLFVQEMDGSISQMIFQYTEGGSGGGKNASVQFLYYAQSKYESWEQVLCLFPYDIGADGTYHSIKGLGTDIFPYCELMDKLNNAIADTVVVGVKPMWQPTTGGDIEKFQMAKWGGGNLVPNGFGLLDMKIGQNLQASMEVSREFAGYLSQNTGAYSQQDVAPPTADETARAATIRATERAKLNKGSANRYMRSKTRQYAEMFRRASNPDLRKHHPGSARALKFQRNCKMLCAKMGVPWTVTFDNANKEFSPTGEPGTFTVLQMVENVRANQSLGLGSAAMRIDIVTQLMANIDRFDEIGQNEIKRMFVATMTSFHQVDAIVPSLANQRDNVNDQSQAADEDNGYMTLGPDAEAFVTPGQNHVIHLSVHMPSMQKDVQDCQSGAVQPQECFQRLEGKAPHAQQHLAILKQNPTRQKEYQQFSQAFQEIASFQDHLQQMLAEQQQNQPPAPGQPDPKMTKVQGDLQLKQQKEQANAAMKQEQQHFNQQLAAQKQQFEQELAAQKAAMEQQIKASDAAFNRRLSDLEAASKIKRGAIETHAKVQQAAVSTNGA